MVLRRSLFRAGVRYRLGIRFGERFTIDVALTRPKIAVFVDGCFWHGCPQHGRTGFSGPNAALWVNKLSATRERDLRATRIALRHGWRVLRFWECEIAHDVGRCVGLILATRRSSDLSRP